MLLDQLSSFLQAYTKDDFALRAREAVLEWALSQDVGSDPAASARTALAKLPQGGSPAMGAFRNHLEIAARGLPKPHRRGGSAARRALALRAA